MSNILTISWRNIWRNKRRTILTVATMSLGLALLLVSLGLGDGGHYQMIDSAVRMGSGHVVIQKEGYQQTRGIAKLLDAEDQLAAEGWIESLRTRFEPQSVLKRIFASGLAASAEDAAGIQIIGIEPVKEKEVSKFFERVIAGEVTDSDDSDRVVLGSGVARKLGLAVGNKLVLTAQEAHGTEIQSMLFHVGCIMQTGLPEIDDSTVLAPLVSVQKFLRMGNSVHQIAVLLNDSRSSEAMAKLGEGLLPGLEILPWTEALPELHDFILVDDAGNYLFNSIFFLLIAFLILNTLLMSVLERNREFALLEAMGLTHEKRFGMVMLEAAAIACISAIIGFGVGYGSHLYFAIYGLPMDLFYSGEISAAGVAFDPVIYSYLSFNRIISSTLILFFMTLVLALIAARRAARAADFHILGRT